MCSFRQKIGTAALSTWSTRTLWP